MAEIQDAIDAIINLKTDLLEKINEVKAIAEADKSLNRICQHCEGDGQKVISATEQIDCPDCGSTGLTSFGKMCL